VECITFQTLCERNAVERIDLVHVDTEGFDYEVMRMIDLRRYQPLVLLYEHKILSDEDRLAAQDLVRGHGYAAREVGGDTLALSPAALALPLLAAAWHTIGRQQA
jgi:hypothetical protein